ncbi:class I SAM-dependent methyltransferase [Luteolibacter sp. AS25]|uniref:class I SAM-dependent methyltransferase n=1 Tax=Luteolibacter sp. AS25 TaxID=3135776 RepID=UPI00398AB8C2
MKNTTQAICPIDGSPMEEAFDATILGKYCVSYFRCPRCLLLQPETPHWLEEAYSSAIARTDVGLVSRNRQNWEILRPILHRIFQPDAKFLDIGGGYGLLCRGLRDEGFDCYTTDQFCQNLYAQDFEPREGFKADALFAFEVLEHIANPLEFIKDAFSTYGCRTLIFSTLTHASEEVPAMDWWYYAFETGQHVSLYHEKSLQTLASILDVNLWNLSEGWHILTDKQPTGLDRFLLRPGILMKLYSPWVKRKRRRFSRLQEDYDMIKKDLKDSNG